MLELPRNAFDKVERDVPITLVLLRLAPSAFSLPRGTLTPVKRFGLAGCKPRAPRHLSRRVRFRIQVISALFAWFIATGTQWDVAQVVAWGRMFAGYSRDMTVVAAAEKTFSGEMCPICRAVQKGRQQQDANGAKAPAAKNPGKLLDAVPLVAATHVIAPVARPQAFVPFEPVLLGEGRDSPPLPPPRSVA